MLKSSKAKRNIPCISVRKAGNAVWSKWMFLLKKKKKGKVLMNFEKKRRGDI